jgi:hypothetical protein
MKAIHSLVTKVDGNKITITGEIMDVKLPDVLAQRHNTVHHLVSGHPSKPRHLQSNSLGFVVNRYGADGVLFPKDEMVSVALEIDHKLTEPPKFTKHPCKESLVGQVQSEIKTTAKIQESTDGKAWTDVANADTGFKGEAGKHYRCVACNAAGETTSNTVTIPAPKV